MIKIYRILDANVNRAAEGIRVVEDICRFHFEDENLTKKLRDIRHKIRKNLSSVDTHLLKYRDADHDIGKGISTASKIDKKASIAQSIFANFKRALEAIRVIEEILKTTEDMYHIGKSYEALRYELYYLEKELMERHQKRVLPEGIYGITFSKFSNGRSNIEIVRDMIDCGITVIQYREKDKSLKEMYEEALILREMTRKAGVVFIINDHVELAMMVDADGVHIGQDDWPLEKVRKLIGDDKIIGLSTHSKEQALEAVELGADYIGVGPIYDTKTKDYATVGVEYLEFVAQNIPIPFVAIGGIKEHNLSEIIKRGAKSFALVTELTMAVDMRAKVEALETIIKS
ncbi:thiamine phosphate synthase [Sulfurospirillum sp. 1612]|uniref:thiamine phosphate synthase n=1 Tax=Sulfurospirillum sp. 1612 TaxID=3094835 RepID=UPI002F9294A3